MAIYVHVWNGTRQETRVARSYKEAMAIVNERHINAYSPTFTDENGNVAIDDGNGLRFEAGKVNGCDYLA